LQERLPKAANEARATPRGIELHAASPLPCPHPLARSEEGPFFAALLPPMTTPDRDALRRHLRERRRAIPAAERIAAADALAERLLALPFAPREGHVAGYWAMDGEIGLHRWQLS